jgi:hypothetical protein
MEISWHTTIVPLKSLKSNIFFFLIIDKNNSLILTPEKKILIKYDLLFLAKSSVFIPGDLIETIYCQISSNRVTMQVLSKFNLVLFSTIKKEE